MVDGFEKDAQEFHRGQRSAECIVGLTDDAVLLVGSWVLRDDRGGVGVGEHCWGTFQLEFLEGIGFDL